MASTPRSFYFQDNSNDLSICEVFTKPIILGWNKQSLGHFILWVMTKKTQELSNPVGGGLKIGPKGFTLGVETNCVKMT
jgi:hypothetical protein